MTKRILIAGLDTFAKKNQAQVKLLKAKGYDVDVICNDSRGDSLKNFIESGGCGVLVSLKGLSPLRKIAAFIQQIKKKRYNHVELYSAGRMSVPYLILSKIYRTPVITVERGDIGCINDYDLLTRLSIRMAHRCADLIWYKEYYMYALLERYGQDKLRFVPNSVEIANEEDIPALGNRSGFLWANRIISQRRCHWVVEAFGKKEFESQKLTVLGFSGSPQQPELLNDCERHVVDMAGSNVRLVKYSDPREHFLKNRFFCFPAEFVFGNNALLEAMSVGMIPIVTEAPGVDKIINDGKNGFVSSMDCDSFFETMESVLYLSDQQLESLSFEARKCVQEKFSQSVWVERLVKMYQEVVN